MEVHSHGIKLRHRDPVGTERSLTGQAQGADLVKERSWQRS